MIHDALIKRPEDYPSFKLMAIGSFQERWKNTDTSKVCVLSDENKFDLQLFDKLLPAAKN